MADNYNPNNPFDKKISTLIYNYLLSALKNSPVVMYYISLDSYENNPFETFRKVHVSELKEPKDVVIHDRECLRIHRDDPLLDYLDDETGFVYVKNPHYLCA